jgi:GNAT superfamily N-acetyltransferase
VSPTERTRATTDTHPAGARWRLRVLRSDDAVDLQALFERCSGYFEGVQGAPPGPAEAQSAFTALPDGATYEEKDLLGLFADGERLVGLVDAVRGWPDARTVMLGTLLLDPSSRGTGMGSEVFESLVRLWRARGFSGARIGVAAGCERALRFWSLHGFVEAERVERERAAGGEIVVMVREL